MCNSIHVRQLQTSNPTPPFWPFHTHLSRKFPSLHTLILEKHGDPVDSGLDIMSTGAPPQSPPRHPRRQYRGRGTPRGGRGRSHGQHPETRPATQAENMPTPADDVDDDQMTVAISEVCIICASPVVYTAVSPCNHQTCHICSLRLRALYKTKACAHCRVSSD